MLCIQAMSLDNVQLNHFVYMQNSTEVLCEVFIAVIQGYIYFLYYYSTYTLTYVTE